MIHKGFVLFLVLFLSTHSIAGGHKVSGFFPELLGLWISANKKQKIRVFYNNKTNTYGGRVEWMYEDEHSEGRQLFDAQNPNPKLRTRRVTGITLLHDFKYEGHRKYRGYVYDPISGKEYRCLLILRPDMRTVEIRGYILLPLLGRTEIATKISD